MKYLRVGTFGRIKNSILALVTGLGKENINGHEQHMPLCIALMEPSRSYA